MTTIKEFAETWKEFKERQQKVRDRNWHKVVVKAVLDVAKLWEQVIAGNSPKEAAWSAARSAAWSAAESAAVYKMSRCLLKLLRSAK